jgi:hypothetical protein
MEPISGRKPIQQIAADHANGIAPCNAPLLRPDPGESVEATAARSCQCAVQQGQADPGQGLGAGQRGWAVPTFRPAAEKAGVAQTKYQLRCCPCQRPTPALQSPDGGLSGQRWDPIRQKGSHLSPPTHAAGP